MQRGRERVHVEWSPEWDGVLKGWTIKFIHQNKWRADYISDEQDLLHDAYLIFCKIRDRYPRVMGEAHFMSLYKRALINHTHDRALYMKRRNEAMVDASKDVSETYANMVGALSHGGYIAAALAEAPEELKLALEIIANRPEELEVFYSGRRKRLNLNEKLRRVLECDPKFDFMKEMFTRFA